MIESSLGSGKAAFHSSAPLASSFASVVARRLQPWTNVCCSPSSTRYSSSWTQQLAGCIIDDCSSSRVPGVTVAWDDTQSLEPRAPIAGGETAKLEVELPAAPVNGLRGRPPEAYLTRAHHELVQAAAGAETETKQVKTAKQGGFASRKRWPAADPASTMVSDPTISTGDRSERSSLPPDAHIVVEVGLLHRFDARCANISIASCSAATTWIRR